MNNNDIKDRLLEIVYTILGKEVVSETYKNDERSMLNAIVSVSSNAILFVTLIEDEFEIEFDDDDINLTFFSSFNYIINCIKRQLGIA
jgi:acyl carrier protein